MIDVIKYSTIVIGTGCAGYNAADWLYSMGQTDIAIITEGENMGTSRNTGSDKQTYYKLSLCGADGDSVREMAQTLFDGGSVNGDTALIEAACSVQSFIKLANLGVPFPTNVYGEYVGYKTDHDPRKRATSCGPLTSNKMTQTLEKSVKSKGIPILDNLQVVKLLVEDKQIYGLIAMSTIDYKHHVFYCDNVILATGGPAGVYYNSVYPQSQTGGTGLALECGALATNLQEWQYGIASTDFRWNVSGTYQQVLPRYIAVDDNGNEREFLLDYFDDINKALDMVFLKGYQWPFDTKKLNGSSKIDMIIHEEMLKGNHIYMDFRTNPTGFDFDNLSSEAYDYLYKSGALQDSPIKRLEHMNKKAIELYASNGIDLYKAPLRVAVCAQHCNGGIAVDLNWESNIKGLFAVGEVAGTFGVYRPGGSALNSTQVGSMRAAQTIVCRKSVSEKNNNHEIMLPCIKYGKNSNVAEKLVARQKRMSEFCAYIRDIEKVKDTLETFIKEKESYFESNIIKSEIELPILYKSYDILTTQIYILSAMLKSANDVGTRGAGLVIGGKDGTDKYLDKILYTNNNGSYFEDVRPIPNGDDWFENVWNEYNGRMNI